MKVMLMQMRKEVSVQREERMTIKKLKLVTNMKVTRIEMEKMRKKAKVARNVKVMLMQMRKEV